MVMLVACGSRFHETDGARGVVSPDTETMM